MNEQTPENKSLPVWRHTGNGWLLNLSTAGTVPGYINWNEATGMVTFQDLDGTVVSSIHARDITSSYFGSDGNYTLRTDGSIMRFKIRGKNSTKSPGTTIKDLLDTFLLDGIGTSILDEKSLANELSSFLASHSSSTNKRSHFRRKLSFKATILIAVAVIVIIFVIGFVSR